VGAALYRIWALARHDLLILRNDPSILAILTLMPLIVVAFVKDLYRPWLLEAGVVDPTGAEQALPGMAVMFSFFLMSTVGFTVFREHDWNTWQRLRASPMRPGEIIVAKTVTPAFASALQLGVLFAGGYLLFGFRIRGSWMELALMCTMLIVVLESLGLALMGLCTTVSQLTAVANLGTMVLAALGGAITPISSLPAWAAPLAPLSPMYWVMRGFRSIVSGDGIAAVALPVAVLAGEAAVLLAVARWRFSMSDRKAMVLA
jgi:ABC-2 type transport system permease protein